MPKTRKTQAGKYKLENILLTVGILLYFAWPIIIAPYSGHLLYCGLASAEGCVDHGNWQDTRALGLTIIGAFIFSIGLVYNLKLEKALKILISISITALLTYFGYWLTFLWFWIRAAIQ
jgi:hypothetical protein